MRILKVPLLVNYAVKSVHKACLPMLLLNFAWSFQIMWSVVLYQSRFWLAVTTDLLKIITSQFCFWWSCHSHRNHECYGAGSLTENKLTNCSQSTICEKQKSFNNHWYDGDQGLVFQTIIVKLVRFCQKDKKYTWIWWRVPVLASKCIPLGSYNGSIIISVFHLRSVCISNV